MKRKLYTSLKFQTALQDLKTNGKIAPVLPYFINFVSNGVGINFYNKYM